MSAISPKRQRIFAVFTYLFTAGAGAYLVLGADYSHVVNTDKLRHKNKEPEHVFSGVRRKARQMLDEYLEIEDPKDRIPDASTDDSISRATLAAGFRKMFHLDEPKYTRPKKSHREGLPPRIQEPTETNESKPTP